MGVFTYNSELSFTMAPARLFRPFFLNANILFPKIAPQAIKFFEIVEGDGGVGSIMKLTFGEGSTFGYLKRKIVKIDESSYSYSYTVIEGDVLSMYKMEKIEYEHKLVANADGGSTLKTVSKYYFMDDVEIKEADVKPVREKAYGLFYLVEAYLKENADLYN